MIRLAVVDDHPAVRVSYAAVLDAHDDVEVVGEAANGLEAVELCRDGAVDAVVMDVRMPVMDGIEATRLIKSIAPATRIILITAYEQDELAQAGAEAGADRFLFKGIPGVELVRHVRELSSGAATCDPSA